MPWQQIPELDFRAGPQVQPRNEDANPADMVNVRASGGSCTQGSIGLPQGHLMNRTHCDKQLIDVSSSVPICGQSPLLPLERPRNWTGQKQGMEKMSTEWNGNSSKNLNMESPYDPAKALPGKYPDK